MIGGVVVVKNKKKKLRTKNEIRDYAVNRAYSKASEGNPKLEGPNEPAT